MRQILVIGQGGQLSGALEELLGSRGFFLGMKELDLSHPHMVRPVLAQFHPTAIINAAAYTQVDKAEQERDLAFAVNAASVGEIAAECASRKIPFLHVSTDYVFDGSGTHARSENEPTGPLNVYGASKLEGEKLAQGAGGQHLIFRTSWVYDESGKNFLNTMLKLGQEREVFRVVSDQTGAPTYVRHLAEAMLAALESAQAAPAFPSGVYHAVCGGETSWCEFARAIFSEAKKYGVGLAVKEVQAIASSEYPTPAKRPLNSRLSCDKLKQTFGITLPSWQQGLQQCMARKYAD